MLKNGHLERENRKTQELARKGQTTDEKVKKNSTLPLTLSMQALPLRYNLSCFHKLLSTTWLAKEFYNFMHILFPFDNELIKHKPREVDAMHEIKIWVLHRLYQQIFKATMLNKMPRLYKNER
jgi:hypothetical protein